MKDRTNRIGYACMNLDTLPSSFRTCRLKNLTEDLHRELVEHNLGVLEAMIDYNILHEAQLYRVSSSLIPFASSEAVRLDWKREFEQRLSQIGAKIRSGKMRISVHPGQYTVINSPRKEVVEASFRELEYHADILEALEADASGKMVLHIGGSYQDRELSIRRFAENYEQLSDRVKARLVIENDDRIFNLQELLRISSMTGAPVIYDNLHHLTLPSMEGCSEPELLEKVIRTWEGKGRPKLHYSQQAQGKPPGAHSSTIDLGKFIADYEKTYRHFDIDIMFEVKDKNRSFKKADLYLRPSTRKFQEEWARYKYLVMSRSYADYLEIRQLMKNGSHPSAEIFYRLIDASLAKEPSLKNELNAFEHIWGYFKNKADQKEKRLFLRDMDRLKAGLTSSKSLGKQLWKLAEKYQENYLLSSYFLKQYIS